MSDPLVVTIQHKLGKEQALARLQPALGTAQRTFPILHVEEEIWAGDRMSFRVRALGQVASGTLTVGETDVRLEVTLPWLLHKFGELIQRTVRSRGQILLEKK